MYSLTLNAAFAHYNDHCKSSGCKQNSIKLNDYTLGYLHDYLKEPDMPIEKLDRYAIRSFLLWLHDEKKLSQSTVRRIYDVMHAMFDFLVEDELLDRSPMSKVAKPQADEAPINVLSTEQVQELVSACDTSTFTGVRNRLVVVLMFDTGLRATELSSLLLDDLDMDERKVLIRTAKSGRPRYVYYSSAVARLLCKYLLIRGERHTDRLIITRDGKEIDRHWLRTMIRRLGEKAGLQVHPHQLRHSCAVNMLINGADAFTVQRVLGHGTLAMTRRYSQLADRDVQQKHRAASPADRLNISNTSQRKRSK